MRDPGCSKNALALKAKLASWHAQANTTVGGQSSGLFWPKADLHKSLTSSLTTGLVPSWIGCARKQNCAENSTGYRKQKSPGRCSSLGTTGAPTKIPMFPLDRAFRGTIGSIRVHWPQIESKEMQTSAASGGL